MVGQTISHYKIIEKLGEGGMGVVYKAHDEKLDRNVALKFISKAFATDEEKKRFLREAQAAAAVEHPNICPIHEIDEADGRVFFVMAFVEGRTITEMVADGPLEFEQAASIVRQVASGLEEAHEHGIVHRDIKGQNIIVNSKGRATILDFGLVQRKGKTRLTATGTTLGTAAYMSPEQARGEETDARTDLWSLGVVLYEALTGLHPFDSEHDLATLYQIVNEEPEPLTKYRADVPLELERVVERALVKDRRERYQSAAEIVADLTAPSGETRVVTGAHRPEARSRRWLVWPAAAALAGLAALGYFWSAGGDASGPATLTPTAQALYDQGQYYLQRYEQSENLDQAIGLFEDARREDPDSPLIEAGLAEAYYRKYISTDDRKWLDGALNAASTAVDRGGRSAQAFAVRGMVQNAYGRSTQAIADFEAARAIDESNVDAVRGLAEAFSDQGRSAEAEEKYSEAIQLAPADWTGYKTLGIFYARQKRFVEAEEQFRSVVRLTPDNALGYNNLGAVQSELGEIDRATESFERSVAIAPRATSYSNLGNLRFYRGQYSEAAGLYQLAIDLSPNEDKYWGNLGDAYRMRRQTGDEEKANDAYGRAIELVQRRLGLNPADAYRRSLLAFWLACLGQTRDAQSEIQQALSLATDNADVLFLAALVHEITGRRVAAEEAYREALRIWAKTTCSFCRRMPHWMNGER